MGFAPGRIVGQLMARILDRAVFGAELLTETHRTGGAGLDAFAACDALFGVALGGIGRSGEVGGVKELRGAQRVADADGAVADAEDLVFPVDVGDLVHIAAVFCLLEDLHGFLVGDVTAVVGLPAVVGEVADADAPVRLDIPGALFQDAHLFAAGAYGDADVSFILLQPVREMLDGQGLTLRGDGLLDRDDMHADAGAAGRHELRKACQGEIGHALKEVRGLGEHVRLLGLDHHDLGAAGNEHVEHPALLVGGVLAVQVLPVILHQAALADGLQSLLQILPVELRVLFRDLLKGHGYAALHGQGDIQDIVGHLLVILDCSKLQRGIDAQILRRLRCNCLGTEFCGHVIGDFPSEFCDFLVFGHEFSS